MFSPPPRKFTVVIENAAHREELIQRAAEAEAQQKRDEQAAELAEATELMTMLGGEHSTPRGKILEKKIIAWDHISKATEYQSPKRPQTVRAAAAAAAVRGIRKAIGERQLFVEKPAPGGSLSARGSARPLQSSLLSAIPLERPFTEQQPRQSVGKRRLLGRRPPTTQVRPRRATWDSRDLFRQKQQVGHMPYSSPARELTNRAAALAALLSAQLQEPRPPTPPQEPKPVSTRFNSAVLVPVPKLPKPHKPPRPPKPATCRRIGRRPSLGGRWRAGQDVLTTPHGGCSITNSEQQREKAQLLKVYSHAVHLTQIFPSVEHMTINSKG